MSAYRWVHVDAPNEEGGQDGDDIWRLFTPGKDPDEHGWIGSAWTCARISEWRWNVYLEDGIETGAAPTLEEARAAALAHAQRLGLVPQDARVET